MHNVDALLMLRVLANEYPVHPVELQPQVEDPLGDQV